jgi:hypothetical protein
MALLIIVYTFFILLTMVVMVLLGSAGIGFLNTEKLERYVHAVGGFTICIWGWVCCFWVGDVVVVFCSVLTTIVFYAFVGMLNPRIHSLALS